MPDFLLYRELDERIEKKSISQENEMISVLNGNAFLIKLTYKLLVED